MGKECIFFDGSDGSCNYRVIAKRVLRVEEEDLQDRQAKGENVGETLSVVQREMHETVPSTGQLAPGTAGVILCKGGRKTGIGWQPVITDQERCDRSFPRDQAGVATLDVFSEIIPDLPAPDADIFRRRAARNFGK